MRDALKTFQDEHISKLKAGSVQSYNMIIKNHLLPKLGKLRVKEVRFSQVAKLHHEMQGTPYLANRTLAVLSKFFSWAELHGYRERNSNPCVGVTKYKEHKRQDFMGAEELSLLGDALTEWKLHGSNGNTQKKNVPANSWTPLTRR